MTDSPLSVTRERPISLWPVERLRAAATTCPEAAITSGEATPAMERLPRAHRTKTPITVTPEASTLSLQVTGNVGGQSGNLSADNKCLMAHPPFSTGIRFRPPLLQLFLQLQCLHLCHRHGGVYRQRQRIEHGGREFGRRCGVHHRRARCRRPFDRRLLLGRRQLQQIVEHAGDRGLHGDQRDDRGGGERSRFDHCPGADNHAERPGCNPRSGRAAPTVR